MVMQRCFRPRMLFRFYSGMHPSIVEQMKLVKERHTILNRDLLE